MMASSSAAQVFVRPLAGVLFVAAGLAGIGALLTGPAGWPGHQVVAGWLGYGVLAAAVWILHRRRAIGGGLGHANLVTLGRAGLTCLIGGALLAGSGASALSWSLASLVALALVLDALDGWLARRFDEVSAFGARFDMEVDALLLLILSTLVWQVGRVDAWVLLIGVLRYGFVLAGRLLPWLRRPLPESDRRKAVCAAQGLALWLALWPTTGPAAAGVVALAALAALVISFAIDVRWLWRTRAPLAPNRLDCRVGCAILRPDGDVAR